MSSSNPGAGPTPDARRGDEVDEYHGHRVPDPYRWLEDPDAPETRAWIEAEQRHTEAFLAQIPERATLGERVRALMDFERYGLPLSLGAGYAYAKNTGLQNQSVVYVAPALDAPARVLLDPNTLSDDGTVALTGLDFSDDGQWVAYASSASGSDWMTWRVRNVATGKDQPDEVRWAKFSGAAWLLDGSGFFYARYPEPSADREFKAANYDHALYFHRIGTPQAQDVLVYERPDHREWLFGPQVTDDGRWLVIAVEHGSDPNNRVFIKDLDDPDAGVFEMLPDADARYSAVGNDGTTFYFLTTKNAPRGRIIALGLHDRVLVEIVPEQADTLEGAALFDDVLVLQYLRDARSVVKRVDLRGRDLGELALPGLGSVGGFYGKRHESETFFSFTSYTTPTTIFRLVPATGATAVVFAPKLTFDPAAFASEQVFYTSEDGTRVPMIVTAKRGLPRDGTLPTILYGYGGFNISLSPGFSAEVLAWLELGGAYAVANLRGGGEYGEAWHQAGMKAQKQNVFDDFVAAAEYLIDEGYTANAKLAVHGGSNGGLLVAACEVQRPDLFAAVVPAVGVLDMLRFQRFTIGWAWEPEYGSSDIPEEFAYLRDYSPLHNIEPGCAYPATLIITADHDDRVFPGHSFKFAAALQAAQGGPAPILIRVETKAGHGAGKPTSKVIDEAADRLAFLVQVLNVRVAERVA